MTIDHESVPRPGRPVSSPRRVATGLLDRPSGGAPARSARSAAGVGRHRRRLHSRVALPAGLIAVDTSAAVVASAATAAAGTHPLVGAALLLPVLLPLNLAGGLYRTRLTLSALDEFPALAARVAVAVAVAVTLGTCLEGRLPAWGPATPLRLLALLLGVLLPAGLGRAVSYHLLR